MNSEDEHIASDIFDVPNSDQSQPLLSFDSLFNKYLRESISEPLSNALAYVIIYRPEDPIEFIANFLINWSNNKARQKLINQESNSILTQCFTDEQREIVFEYDKHS